VSKVARGIQQGSGVTSEEGRPYMNGCLVYRITLAGMKRLTFQVMRRTNGSLSHKRGIDPKVAADQRGHGIGVSLDVYTRADLVQKLEAVRVLDSPVGNWLIAVSSGFFGGCKFLKMERETGVEPATSSLGN